MHIIISIQNPNASQNILNAFDTKSKFKNNKKSVGDAFGKHADDVTSGGSIFAKFQKLSVNKNSNSGWRHKKLSRLGAI